MVIIGDKYKFITIDFNILNKKFKKIKYIEDTIKEEEFKLLIIRKKPLYIVLNITNSLTLNIFINFCIKYKIKYLMINNFLEKFLYKSYIPHDYKKLSYLENIQGYSKLQYIQKKIVDYLGLFLIFVFSSYLFLFKIPKKIKEESEGEIYFKQKRVGKDNKKFDCFKFRTMYIDSHFNPYTSENDSRIFPYGTIMRKKRLDELPQIINILKNDMHLIGPRAEWDILVEEYEKKNSLL